MKQLKCCMCGEIMNVEDAYSNLAVAGAVGHKDCVMTFTQNKEKHLVKLVLGDWSDDGHGKCEEICFESNYPVQDIQKAYMDSCKLTGIQFNYNTDYTDGLCKGYGSWRQPFTEYESSCLKPEAIKALRMHGLDPAEYCDDRYSDEGRSIYFYVETAADLIMAFIKLSMPNDWKYDKIELDAHAINGYWGKLNEQFGYGLFY